MSAPHNIPVVGTVKSKHRKRTAATPQLQTFNARLFWGVTYLDSPGPRVDRIACLAVCLVTGFVLLDPLLSLLVRDCLSERCSPPLWSRILGAFLGSFSTGALFGWAAAALLRRVLHGSAS